MLFHMLRVSLLQGIEVRVGKVLPQLLLQFLPLLRDGLLNVSSDRLLKHFRALPGDKAERARDEKTDDRHSDVDLQRRSSFARPSRSSSRNRLPAPHGTFCAVQSRPRIPSAGWRAMSGRPSCGHGLLLRTAAVLSCNDLVRRPPHIQLAREAQCLLLR